MGRGVRGGMILAFGVGWGTFIAALASPLHALAERSFFGHMLVHELLMVVAAPLLVLARPLGPFAWAMPPNSRTALLRSGLMRGLLRLQRRLTAPITATVLQAAVLSLWHLPALFNLALANRLVHSVQHLTLLLASLLFWWGMLERRGSHGGGLAALCLFLTMLHGTMLGALLTLAPSLWYAADPALPPPFGLDPLADQQLGGLIMWVPGGLVYAAAALALVARWLQASASRPSWMPLTAPRDEG